MPFSGFTPQMFEVFEIPTFGERMMGIKNLVRPVLVSLGEDLVPSLSELVGHPLYPHVALHARRRVNPPDETWVAFARNARGYKACAHFAVGISSQGIWAGLVIKDESPDRVPLGEQILHTPRNVLKELKQLGEYEIEELKVGPIGKVTTEQVCKLGEFLAHRKTSTFHCTLALPRTDPRVDSPAGVEAFAREAIGPLLPLYRWAVAPPKAPRKR